ncbi:hypothetical protein HHL28_15250 [Aerophototrophica crusticola]|uniref:GNAT family N-acetyltransferase n=1 Tax=Aerophototrophica crusticola TaxID=1709002 RepID=A0A858RBA3_9PROT|nr:hypothetical protein HHL28_15250 [Rhodospirillaceae bacterium B3]
MPDSFDVKPLDARRVDQAFPVVQTAFPRVSVERWREYALQLMGPPLPKGRNVVRLPTAQPSGVMVAQLGHGYIHGLFTYQTVPSLSHGKVLQVDMLVALDLFDPVSAAEALLVEMERLAHALRCDAIHLSLPQHPQSDQLAKIEKLGHHIEGLRLCKPLVTLAAE